MFTRPNLPTWVLLMCCLLIAGCGQKDSEKLTIATAANMQFVMKALVKSFSQQSGIKCETVVSSSGKLTAQIQEGAPFDIFVSADMKYPTSLYEKGLTTGPPKIYAYGQLVLWSASKDIQPSIGLLTDAAIKHIALANPKTAPYGRAAVEVLQHFQIYDQVKSKLVYGESISQTNQFILSNAAEVGFTAQSVVLSPELKDKGHWQALEANHYTPIAQGVVLLKSRQAQLGKAQQFYTFLFSNTAKEILTTFGYELDAG